jgi:DhnA family fructose-bisphosphate aldolase class Ia
VPDVTPAESLRRTTPRTAAVVIFAALLAILLAGIGAVSGHGTLRLHPAALEVPAAASHARVSETRTLAAASADGTTNATRAGAAQHRLRRVLRPARGLGVWVDLYDYGARGNPPVRTIVATAARHHAHAIWVETSRYNTRDIAHPGALSALIDRAHAHGMKVIAWTLPAFRYARVDERKARAAAKFRSRGGHRFAAVALDIEVSTEAKAPKRNRHLVRIVRDLHGHLGRPLYGIVPPPIGFAKHPTYWPHFPWVKLSHHVDSIVTMGYWSYSSAAPGHYTTVTVKQTRKLVGDPHYPVVAAGGLAANTSPTGVRRFCHAAANVGALGASLYDLASTPTHDWKPLQSCRSVGR